MNDPSSEEVIGQVLNNTYRITREIAAGGMGAIYEAVNVRLSNKRFAVKLLHPALAKDPGTIARFRREAEIATSLGHRHIVDVLDFHQTDRGQPYMVMEYLEGQTLQDLLSRVGTLVPQRVLEIVEQVGSALQAAHDNGIVHRDMKPENIFLEDLGGEVIAKVLDFGISKIRDSTSVVTGEGMILGTSFYMSPEQALGAHDEVDHTTDIFALGVITYQALSGSRPFDAPTVPAVLFKIINEDPRPLIQLAQHLRPAVGTVIARSLAKKRADRFERVADFVTAFGRALGDGTQAGGAKMTMPAGSGSWRPKETE